MLKKEAVSKSKSNGFAVQSQMKSGQYGVNYNTCMYYYADKNYCCNAAYDAPYSQCYYYWGDY